MNPSGTLLGGVIPSSGLSLADSARAEELVCLLSVTSGGHEDAHVRDTQPDSHSPFSLTGPAVAVRRQSTTPSKSKADKAQTQNNSLFVDLLEIINCIQMTVSCRYKPDVGIPRLSSISVQSGSSKPSSGAVAGMRGGTCDRPVIRNPV
ncbi:hypothetical protein Q5P01_001243 [Channa striata]|uniref:Uncharacterized protein n=1 Tax=Channa striata TaxID=64152 RepID=A0AA88TC44_CHASR|nr:hypothetical protein Q5P01_001243 [Channa striata]